MYEGNFDLPQDRPPPGQHQNNMCPYGMEVHHQAYAKLFEYSTKGFPVKTGHNWSKEEIHAAVMRGPHESDFSKESIAHFAAEEKAKMASKQLHLVWYDMIKDNLPEQMKVFPITAIPHKSKAFPSILDLAFSLRLIHRGRVSLVNENSEKMAPAGAIDKIGNVLMRLIHDFSEVPDDAKIFQA